ncbi:MAG: RNA polymerase factor sigma-54, partial [Pirellulales bacterium]|nr:RNA polymerase factor sigma-54 [Pirellulales bacterium]
MRLSLNQELRLVQKQVLAPRMIQSMEILQLPIMALQERIEQEIQENPCLEQTEDESDDWADSSQNEERESPDAPALEEKELVVDQDHNNEEDFERLMSLGDEWRDRFEEAPSRSASGMAEDAERKLDAMANMEMRPQTLHDHLHEQLSWFDLSVEVRTMCDRIIYNLDANGYLQGSLDDLVSPEASEEEREVAEKALDIVQRLDPAGVGARDLRECLLLQLKPGMPFFEELQALIGNHLEDIEHNRMPVISRKTGYSIEHIEESLEHLRKLNPKPGAEYSEEFVPSVTPDVFLDETPEGYKVRLEAGNLPSLNISNYYRQLLSDKDTPAETKEYIKRKVNAAQWLIESIEQRRSTLTKVSQAIIDHQTMFLEKGPEAIEPLKMQQIADKVGVHVTTVSRAVDDKWIQTPRGIYPLKRFFVGGTVSTDGEEVTWDAIRLKLQEIVDNEDKAKPYSDDQLVAELAKHSLKVARRTVTKYRKAMNIPSSRQRKDWTATPKKKQPAKS